MKAQSTALALATVLGLCSGACNKGGLGTRSRTGGSSISGPGGASRGDASGSDAAVGTGGALGTGGRLAAGSSTANGGSSGDAGASGKGGSHSSAGVTGQGGRSRVGGTFIAGTGGNLGSGGRTISGGTGGSGAGATGEGGATGAGGGRSTGGSMETGGSSGAGGSTAPAIGPCDIYAAASPPTPCVAAYSTVRALLAAYSGYLYQVKMADGTTKDIGVLTPGGFASSADQDAFCGTDACTVSVIYDQSGQGNHLMSAPKGCYLGTATVPSNESNANGRALTVGGHKVYALYMNIQDGYRNNQTTGMPTGSAAQGIYEVVDGKRYGDACCWDFGNATTDNCYNGLGSSNALFFGVAYWGRGAGSGPWFMADFETGIWAGGAGASTVVNLDNPPVTYDYAMGILKTNATNYAIRVGNGQAGSLVTAYDGELPFTSWSLEGGIVLGLASDASNSSLGTFFEGAITAGRPSDAADEAVLKNIQAAGYGQ